MALVPDFNYNNNQIDTEKWETQEKSLQFVTGIVNEDLPGWASKCSNTLQKPQPVVIRQQLAKHLMGHSKPSLCYLLGVLEKQCSFGSKYI